MLPAALADALSGAAGALCLVAVGAPFDTLKVLAQTSATSPLAAARGVVRASGPLALWRGAAPALASALVENVVVFAALGALHRAAAAARGADAPPLTFAGHAALGAAAGVASATAICPAEVVKCTMQAGAAAGGARGGAAAAAAAIARAGGARALFRGLGPLLARDVPLNGVMFAVQDAAARALAALPEGPRAALAGGLAGAVAWAAVFPLDTIKSRVQARGGGARAALAAALAGGGARGLYRGLSAAVARAFVANAALFCGVELAGAALR